MSYLGAKGQAGTFQRIIGQMPPHSIYVEPFFGSGQIFFRKRPADRNVIIDADAGVIARFNASGRAGKSAFKLVVDTTAFCGDALVELKILKPSLPPDALIYCDPPYVLSTRKSRNHYAHEMSDDQHQQLLTLLEEMKCRVLISGYPSELYISKLRNWRCITYRTRTRGRTVTECLWCNFPEPTELHDWRFAGLNFRKRTALKRKAARWTNRIEKLPARERGYLLHAIQQSQIWRGRPELNAKNGVAR